MIRTLTPRGWGLLAAVPVAAVLITAASVALPGLALINESRSLPRGLYLREIGAEPKRGDIAAAAQPARIRPYLTHLGAPADMVLIKRVAAVGGDRVCRDGGRLQTPQGVVVVLTHDRRGARLPHWSGCRRLRDDELLLLGDTPASFDGRYFGPVGRSEIRGVYRAAITW